MLCPVRIAHCFRIHKQENEWTKAEEEEEDDNLFKNKIILFLDEIRLSPLSSVVWHVLHLPFSIYFLIWSMPVSSPRLTMPKRNAIDAKGAFFPFQFEDWGSSAGYSDIVGHWHNLDAAIETAMSKHSRFKKVRNKGRVYQCLPQYSIDIHCIAKIPNQ